MGMGNRLQFPAQMEFPELGGRWEDAKEGGEYRSSPESSSPILGTFEYRWGKLTNLIVLANNFHNSTQLKGGD